MTATSHVCWRDAVRKLEMMSTVPTPLAQCLRNCVQISCWQVLRPRSARKLDSVFVGNADRLTVAPGVPCRVQSFSGIVKKASLSVRASHSTLEVVLNPLRSIMLRGFSLTCYAIVLLHIPTPGVRDRRIPTCLLFNKARMYTILPLQFTTRH